MTDRLQQLESVFAATVSGDQGPKSRDFINKVKPASRISPRLAVEIYSNNTRGARVSALEQIFPVCRRVLGDNVFRSLAADYVSTDRHGSADLNTYGISLPRHLRTLINARRLPPDFAYLEDLARLEYMYNSAYYADDDPTFDFARFEQAFAHGTRIRFRPSQSLGLIASHYPVHQIWISHREQRNSDRVSAIDDAQYVVVFREDFLPAITQVGYGAFWLLEAVSKGLTLQKISEHKECAIDRLLPKLIANKWIVGIYDNGRP